MALWTSKTSIIVIYLALLICAINVTCKKTYIPPPCKHNGLRELEEYRRKFRGRSDSGIPVFGRTPWDLEKHGIHEKDARDIIPPVDGNESMEWSDEDTPKWSDSVIPYYITPKFKKHEVDQIMAAFQHISSKTCILFRPWDPRDGHWLYITNENKGCWTYVGSQLNGGQAINLGDGCADVSVAIHELLHALGLWLERESRDRGDYSRMKKRNAPDDQFTKHSWNQVVGRKEGDHSGRVMHFDADAITIKGELTIEGTNSGKKVRRAKWLTKRDIKELNRMYDCPERESETESGNSGTDDSDTIPTYRPRSKYGSTDCDHSRPCTGCGHSKHYTDYDDSNPTPPPPVFTKAPKSRDKSLGYTAKSWPLWLYMAMGTALWSVLMFY